MSALKYMKIYGDQGQFIVYSSDEAGTVQINEYSFQFIFISGIKKTNYLIIQLSHVR